MKRLHMIGNSHIDPVWFWNWEEGMQEVKSTLLSALDRMNEYEDFRFTCTSQAFLRWIEEILPDKFEEIRKRVAEGRWELTGGWFIEPDCILPGGEAFVRQGLYSQRYFKEKFGKICRIGSNVDSFGHNHILPQILKKSGMDSYVYMRPRHDLPVFRWVSDDGSEVTAISLPSEYTAWFYQQTKRNVDDTLKRTTDWESMVCCYGVGNHGGGPTKANIECVKTTMAEEYPEVDFVFSSYEDFLKEIDKDALTEITGPFEKVNPGCYSADSAFKKLNRQAEKRLRDTDVFLSMARGMGRPVADKREALKDLWQLLLFNHFHDTMGGTAIKPARDEAIMQMSCVCAQAGIIKALAIQNIVNTTDTVGEGYPLFLFNTSDQPWHDYVTVELEWYNKNPLTLWNPEGQEIPYQRVHSEAKIRHVGIGGRRRFVFLAEIPPMGYAVYRTLVQEPTMVYNNGMELDDEEAYVLENDYIKVIFDRENGWLTSCLEKETGFEALKGPMSLHIWADERDTWGHEQGKRFCELPEKFTLESIKKVESGKFRQTIRAIYTCGESRLTQLYTLYPNRKEVLIENRLCWVKPWTMLKMGFFTGVEANHTKAETSYGVLHREIKDTDEYYMHRFLDVANQEGGGLAIANDGKYAFNMADGRIQLTVARSTIYAQGQTSGPDWQNEYETYEYTDLGEQTFLLTLMPHQAPLENRALRTMAEKLAGTYEYLADNNHPGQKKQVRYSFASTDSENVAIALVKQAEDDEDYVVRLLELEGKDCVFTLYLAGEQYPLSIGHHEIKTVKINSETKIVKEVNLLEWEAES